MMGENLEEIRNTGVFTRQEKIAFADSQRKIIKFDDPRSGFAQGNGRKQKQQENTLQSMLKKARIIPEEIFQLLQLKVQDIPSQRL